MKFFIAFVLKRMTILNVKGVAAKSKQATVMPIATAQALTAIT